MTISPTEAEVIFEAIESRLLDVHTAIPGIIASYSAEKQTADIDIAVDRMIEDESGKLITESLPRLPNVPIAFPRSGQYFVSFPMAKGDRVWIMFSESSIDQFRSKGTKTTPADGRRLSLTGAIAYPADISVPGIIPFCSGTEMVAGKIGGQRVRIKSGGTVEITDDDAGSADDFVAQAQKVRDENQIVYDALVGAGQPVYPVANAAQAIAWINAIGVYLDANGYPNSVASSNLKSDD